MANKKVKIILGISVVLIAGGALFYKLHPHDYVLVDTKEPTCTEDGYNNYRCWCGTESKEVLEAIGHDYQTETIDATCIDDGKTIYTCANCGDTYTEPIAPLGHSYIDGICERCGELSEEKKKAEEEQKKKEEETKKKQEESKKAEQQSGGGSGNGGSSSQKPSGNSGQSGNNVSNETPSNDISEGAADWGFGGGSSPTTADLDNIPTGGIQGE